MALLCVSVCVCVTPLLTLPHNFRTQTKNHAPNHAFYTENKKRQKRTLQVLENHFLKLSTLSRTNIHIPLSYQDSEFFCNFLLMRYVNIQVDSRIKFRLNFIKNSDAFSQILIRVRGPQYEFQRNCSHLLLVKHIRSYISLYILSLYFILSIYILYILKILYYIHNVQSCINKTEHVIRI